MNKKRSKVVLLECDTYSRASLRSCIEAADQFLHAGDGVRGKKVLLKPNLISSRGPAACCTHPEFIRAVADFFLDRGAKVLVGDSPAFGSGSKVCAQRGISEALKGCDATIIDFEEPVSCRLENGVDVPVARAVLESDLVVGLPKIKAHQQMYVTLAIKNLFGIVKGANKAMFHMKEGGAAGRFSEIILGLRTLLPDQLHLADGIEALHVSGPIHGEPLTLGCVAAAKNPVSLDRAVIELLELHPDSSPLARAAVASNVWGAHVDEIEFPALSPDFFHGSGFIAPSALEPIRFNPLRFTSGMFRRLFHKVTS